MTPWTILAGTLSIGADAALGSNLGGLTLNGGALAITDDISMSRGVTFGANGGTVNVAAGASVEMSGLVDGTGNFTKSGTGELTFVDGVSSFAQTLTVAAGQVNLGDGGAPVGFGGDVAIDDGATFAIGHATGTLALGGDIGGEGLFVVNGGGIVTLTGDLSGLTGDVSVQKGILALSGNASLANAASVDIAGSANSELNVSAIAGDGTTIKNLSGTGALATVALGSKDLTIEQVLDSSFAGSFTGDDQSALTKSGIGKLTLSGDSSLFEGETSISGGTPLLAEGKLGGTVTVADGGTLGGKPPAFGNGDGRGRGTLSPGSSPGTLTFTDDLTLETGSTTTFELATPRVVGGADNDLIEVEGALSIEAGSALDITVGAADFTRCSPMAPPAAIRSTRR
ncbi:hypothetical protein MWN33_15610 [Starkeya koreensis]|uniref:Autotransporter-associated beta strand repeat-containing protein n=1 Tax=Ancylobacter koreensis TaxID=266121 RepID=A0ABT0DQB5_9HYPH|nr:hypothetical protein [Ancylobacter koreensis]